MDLTANDIGVELNAKDVSYCDKVVSYPTLSFGDGLLTIPAGGLIPLPPQEKFGMKREIKRLVVCGGGGSGYVFEYVPAPTHALLALMGNYDSTDGPLIPAAGVAIPATVLPLIVVGE